eukprot:gene8817-11905_t
MNRDRELEENMLRLATEISLVEMAQDQEMRRDDVFDWSIQNLDEANNTVRLCEEIVDEHLSFGAATELGNWVDTNLSDAMTEEQIKELFFLTGNKNDNKIESTRSIATHPHQHHTHAYKSKMSLGDLSFSKINLFRRSSGSSGRGKEEKSKHNVLTMSGKLRLFQSRIVQTIESTQPYDKDLATLLELNDRVSNVLTKADFIAHDMEFIPPSTSLTANSAFNAPTTKLQKIKPNNQMPSTGKSSSTSDVQGKGGSKPKPIDSSLQQENFDSSYIVSTVYALSRGGGRQETLAAVNKLIVLCNLGGDVRLTAVKAMMAAGALQSLLSTLARSGDWPEVEIQISKVVSLLVTYEDDWSLVRRSAYLILSSLYTLQLKTQARSKTSSSGVGQSSHPIGSDESNQYSKGKVELSLSNPADVVISTSDEVELFSIDDLESITVNTPKVYGDVDSFEAHKAHEKYVESDTISEQSNCEQKYVKLLVSAAIAKLSLVLSTEWVSPNGGTLNSTQTQSLNGNPGSSLMGIGMNNSSMIGIGEFKRQSSGTSLDKKNASAPGSRPRSGSAAAESSKIVEIMLNLILTVCDNSLNPAGVGQLDSKDSSFGGLSAVSSPNKPLTRMPHVVPEFQKQGQLYSNEQFININNRLTRTVPSTPNDANVKGEKNYKHYMHFNDSVPSANGLVDSSAVLCSAALSNLAELPQCRPGLVSGGALRIIKCWLEIGIEVMREARMMFFESMSRTASHSPSGGSASNGVGLDSFEYYNNQPADNQKGNEESSFSSFLKTYGQAYELISNAAAALMYISGGSDCRFQSFTSTSKVFGTGGNDYIVGWIDAQIMSENLPAVVVQLILTGVEDFTCLDISDEQTLTRSVLPAAVGMHLAQTLFQLCSRMQNRQQFQVDNIPKAICLLFENIISQAKYITKNAGQSPRPNESESIFSYIFHIGGVYYQGTHAGSVPMNYDWESTNDLVSLYSTSIDDKNNHVLYVQPRLSNSGHVKSPTVGSFSVAMSPPPLPTGGSTNTVTPTVERLSSNINLIMSAITSSCLDTLNFFFSDEIAKFPYSTLLSAGNSSSSFSAPNNLVWMMSHPRVISSILLAASYLHKGQGRLSSIRIISSLSEWPESLSALYSNNVIDVLVFISSESDELQNKLTNRPSHHNSGDRDDIIHGTNVGNNYGSIFNIAKPSGAERSVSGQSTASAISSISKSSFYRTQERHSSYRGSTPTGFGDDNEDDEYQRHIEVDGEETLIVCYALANIGQANEHYAKRMFNSGLVTIMIRLIKSVHPEISRQALRCLSVMIPAISSESIEKAIFMKPRNNTLFIDALEALSYASKSSNLQVQKAALTAMAQLASLNEHIQDAIVAGPLRPIISTLVNPRRDRELRGAAEEVVKNVGFLGGVKDFEVCGFDFEVLRDWYAMKRALKPQDVSYDILCHWIDNLFSEDIPTNIELFKLHHSYQADVDALNSAFGLANEAVNILHHDSPSRHSVDLGRENSFSDVAGGSERISFNRAHSTNYVTPPGNLLSADQHSRSEKPHGASTPLQLALPHFHRHITEGFMRYFPFCGHSSKHETDRDSTGSAYPASPGSTHHMNRSLQPTSQNNILSPLSGNPHSVQHRKSASQYSETYDWLDRPPVSVSNLLDLFYTSRLHQLVVMDLVSLGVPFMQLHHGNQTASIASVEGENMSVSQSDTDYEELLDADTTYSMPKPVNINAILFPSRTYHSFVRVGRVLEKMFEYSEPSKLWSLTFRNSDFMGDFHTSLLSCLRRCPQICSLSFDSTATIEEDALLGHLVGQIPPSVRFLSFKSTLSKESIQALCILLRTHNYALMNMDYDFVGSGRGHKRTSSFNKQQNYGSPPPMNGKGDANERLSGGKTYGKQSREPVRTIPSKGLLGLALTHLSLEQNEISHIIELLQVASPITSRLSASRQSSFSKLSRLGFKHSSSSQNLQPSYLGPPQTIKNSNNVIRGLRFLDLSFNGLSDSACTKILIAALSGPLEGLELCGNVIHRGVKFMEAMDMFTHDGVNAQRNYLRHLGLSQNSLTNKAVCSLLTKLTDNDTLTSLDLSTNDIDNNSHTHEALRNFIKFNIGLRSLDLCYNKLSTESYREVHLGLLENNTMLLLPLAGNYAVEKCPTISLIQIKLRENRLLYKSRTRPDLIKGLNTPLAAISESNSILDISASMAVEGVRFDSGREDSSTDQLSITAIDICPSSDTPHSMQAAIAVQAFHVDSPNHDYDNRVAKETQTSIRSRSNSKTGPSHSSPLTFIVTHEKSSNEAPPSDAKVGSVRSNEMGEDSMALTSKSLRQSLTISLPSNVIDSAEQIQVPIAVPVATLATTDPHLTILNRRLQTGTDRSRSNSGVAGNLPMTISLFSESKTSSNSTQKQEFKPTPDSPNHKSSNITKTNSHDGKNNSIVEVVHSNKSTLSVENVKLHTELTAAGDHKLSHPSTADNAIIEATTKIDPDRVAITNTLHVLFSAPLAGFDRNHKPVPLEVLDYSAERDILIQVFKEVHRDVNVHFDFATTDTLRTLLSLNCKALHFSGHGIPNGLCFEDKQGGLQVISVQRLRDLLAAGGLTLQFVFVSACYSKEIGEAFVKAGVPHVVCVKVDSKIQDAAAIAFTRAFYVALLSGKTVQDSFDIAKEALKSSPYVPYSLLEGEKFILLPESNSTSPPTGSANNTMSLLSASNPSSPRMTVTKSFSKDKLDLATSTTNDSNGSMSLMIPPLTLSPHRKVIFSNRPVADWPSPGHCTIGTNRTDVTAFLSRNRLPPPPADFEGREVVMLNLIRSILNRRLVSLTGEDGAGKSSVAAVVCKYIADRELFPDSVVFVKAKKVKDYRSFLRALHQSLLMSGSNAVAKKLHGLSAHNTQQLQTQSNLVYPEEEVLFSCLEDLKMLLVIDHLDDLLADYGENVTDFRLFLSRLFEQCHHIRVLAVCTDTLNMHNINVGYGIIEYSHSLGPLSLNNTLRLFSRLAPSLSTAHDKSDFIDSLTPKSLQGVHHGRDLQSCVLRILSLIGDGNPSKIVHIACESTPESVERLKEAGKRIIGEYTRPGAGSGTAGISSDAYTSPPIPLSIGPNSTTSSTTDHI